MLWAASTVCILFTCLPACRVSSAPTPFLSRVQSALDDVEEHLQPFLEAGPKEMAEQVTGGSCCVGAAPHPLNSLAAAGCGRRCCCATALPPTPCVCLSVCLSICLPVCLQLTPLERLKAHLALAQAAVVLYTLDRQLDAAKLEGHPIQKELVRLWLWLV